MTTSQTRSAGEWIGAELGTRTLAYTERDAILYALAVGARATDLDLVFETRLRVLPTFALTLAQWAPDALGGTGAFDTATAVHGAQHLRVHAPLPASGELAMTARVANVWDKGSAAVFDVAVECDYFVATWSIFAPGAGGFGGERGPSSPKAPEAAPDTRLESATAANQAALYRLLGDRHHMHIDPAAAQAAGQPRPFLHGLCTLASATIPIAGELGVHPADLLELRGRFAAPVFPGETLEAALWRQDSAAADFTVAGPESTVISGGSVVFAEY